MSSTDGGARPRRALILAGGGIKVAFQAGVLQVWLDEAGLEFDLADGASGGTFNLAMWVQGMTGTEIADNWRKLPAEAGVDPNWHEYPKLFLGESLMKLDKFRDSAFTTWGLDWEKINASQREATFNVYNFSKHQLEILEPAQMDAEFLVACVSLPMWFPPVRKNGQIYIDPVYITDANLEEAIRRGADELWVIWTASERGVEAARRWCLARGIAIEPEPDKTAPGPSLRFTEEMKGFVALGETDFENGYREGKSAGTRLMVHLTIEAENVNRFVVDPEHEAAVTGYIDCEALGGRLEVESGSTFNLFVDEGDPRSKRMLYRLLVTDGQGRQLTVSGHKEVHDDPGLDLYADTTTLYTRVLAGHVSAEQEAGAEVVAAGIIRIHLVDFLRQLTTFRTSGGSVKEQAAALGRFGALFLGSLWDVYAARVLSSGPV